MATTSVQSPPGKDQEPANSTGTWSLLQQHQEQVRARMELFLKSEELILEQMLRLGSAPTTDAQQQLLVTQGSGGGSQDGGFWRQEPVSPTISQCPAEYYSEIAEKHTKPVHTGLRKWALMVVEKSWFELVIRVAIIFNGVLIGIEVHYGAMTKNLEDASSKTAEAIFWAINAAFAVLFLFELVLRICSERGAFFMLSSSEFYWNWLDLVVVTITTFEILLDAIFSAGVQSGGNATVGRLIRVVRITRLSRVLRITRIVRFIRALRVLTYSVAFTLKSVVWTMVLLLLVMYFFAILLTQTTTEFISGQDTDRIACDSDECNADTILLQESCNDLFTTMFTLFQTLTNGLDWGPVALAFRSVSIFWVLIFLLYVLLSQFAVLNMVTSAFCQGFDEGKQFDKDLLVKELLSGKRADIERARHIFSQLFKTLDKDGSGRISAEEFRENLGDKSVHALLTLLELEPDEALSLFELMDSDGSAEIEPEEFIVACLRIRGNARSIDMARLAADQKKFVRQYRKTTTRLHNDMAALKLLVASIWDKTSQGSTPKAEMAAETPSGALQAEATVMSLTSNNHPESEVEELVRRV